MLLMNARTVYAYFERWLIQRLPNDTAVLTVKDEHSVAFQDS
jgi:hypothetical protein